MKILITAYDLDKLAGLYRDNTSLFCAAVNALAGVDARMERLKDGSIQIFEEVSPMRPFGLVYYNGPLTKVWMLGRDKPIVYKGRLHLDGFDNVAEFSYHKQGAFIQRRGEYVKLAVDTPSAALEAYISTQ